MGELYYFRLSKNRFRRFSSKLILFWIFHSFKILFATKLVVPELFSCGFVSKDFLEGTFVSSVVAKGHFRYSMWYFEAPAETRTRDLSMHKPRYRALCLVNTSLEANNCHIS